MENPWLEKDTVPTEDIPLAGERGDADDEEGGWDNAGGMDDMAKDYRTEDDIPEYLLQTRSDAEGGEHMEYSETQTFYDMLMSQVGEFNLTEHEQQLKHEQQFSIHAPP